VLPDKTAPENKRPPHHAWYLLALLIFLAGPLLSAYLVYNFFKAPKQALALSIPQNAVINIPQPGQYTLWLESQQKLDSSTLNLLKNINLVFTDPTGKTINFVAKVGWHGAVDNTVHTSLGSIYFDTSGQYQVTTVTPYNNVPVKVYLRQPSFENFIKLFILSLSLIVISVVCGILCAIVVLAKRINSRAMIESKPTTPLGDQDKNSTTWAMFCHLSGFAGFLFPFGNIIAPLIIWGLKRHDSPYIDSQGKEAINFQISMVIYYAIAALLILVLVGLIIISVLAIFQIIVMIIAAVDAAQGRDFRYPLSIRFIH
jgi:uncharacterized Tic20 family protein